MTTVAEWYAQQHKRHVEAGQKYVDDYTDTTADQSHAYVRDAFEAAGITVGAETCTAALIGAIWHDLCLNTCIQSDPALVVAVRPTSDQAVTAGAAAFINAAVREKTRRGPIVEPDFVEQTRTLRNWVKGKGVDAGELIAELDYWLRWLVDGEAGL